MATATLQPTRDTRATETGWQGDDFPAWISPMLVKELRQGLQSGVFFWTFLLFQAVLFLVFSIQVLSDSGADKGSAFLFWLAAVVAVSVIVPLRGVGAISGERSGNGLDLLNLTRLSATRIVIGKWIALVAQSALLAVTLLPYCTLRYFFGGVDVLAELQGLGWILAAGAVVAAAAVALSTVPLGFRVGVSIAVSLVGLVALIAVMERSPRMVTPWWTWLTTPSAILATLVIYTYAFLEFAAAKIASPVENHAARKRIFALALASSWPIVGWWVHGMIAVGTFVVTGPLILAYAVGAMIERPSHVRTLFRPFRKAGLVGRLAATVLTPGWASGLVCVAILVGLCGAGASRLLDQFPTPDQRLMGFAFASLLVAAIVFPLPVTSRVTEVRYAAVLYFLMHLLGFMTFAFANAFKYFQEPWWQYETGQLVTLPLPIGAVCSLVAILRSAPNAYDVSKFATAYTAAGLVVIGVVLVAVAWPWFRQLSSVGRLIRGDAGGPLTAMRRSGVGRAAATQPWLWRGDDFPSWLAPMLVRELRQGVQSGVFAWTFIGIQAAMFALMTWAVGSFGGGPSGIPAREFSAIFWFAIAAAIVVVVPLRGLTAVSSERVGNNLDLVRLSRLSATQIILGKWLAIVCQCVLVATALLPYLVLRYFLGGVDVVSDLEVFGWMAVTALGVTAAAIALSTRPLWVRIAICLLVVMAGFVPVIELLESVTRSRRGFGGWSIATRLGIIAGIAVYTVVVLEYAAAMIAPAAENHAGRKRLMAIAIALAWAVTGIFGSSDAAGATIAVTAPLVLCFVIESLLEQPVPIASLYRPFYPWGGMGRAAAAVFTPGWATALPCVGIVAGLCFLGWAAWLGTMQGGKSFDGDAVVVGATIASLIVSALVFPLPFLVYLPKVRARFLVYALVQLVCFLVFVYLSAVAPSDGYRSWRDWGGWVFAMPFPLASLPSYMRMGTEDDLVAYAPVFIIAALVTTVVVLACVAKPWRAEMRSIQRLLAGRRSQTREHIA
jgi:hypothetical protein